MKATGIAPLTLIAPLTTTVAATVKMTEKTIGVGIVTLMTLTATVTAIAIATVVMTVITKAAWI